MNDTKEVLRVALVTPPILGHTFRGTGVYTDRLYSALKKFKEVYISLVEVSDNLEKFDLVHYPFFDPFFLTLPLNKKKPTIVTVHDLIPLKFPQFFPPGIRGKIKWLIQRFSLSTASLLITDSYASKEDIVRLAKIDEKKIRVIYLGVGKEFKIVKDKQLETIKKKLKLPKEFILHVGDVNYNKNITAIVKTFHSVGSIYPSLHLVFVGNGFVTSSKELSEILKLIDSLGIGNKVHRYGHVETFELVTIYNLAKLYLQPSFAEGFGLPVLEGMACGCPTVVSNLSSLKEIAGEASKLVDPYNTYSITKGILEVIKDNTERERLIKEGLKRIKLFSWEKCAKETIDIYKKVLEDN